MSKKTIIPMVLGFLAISCFGCKDAAQTAEQEKKKAAWEETKKENARKAEEQKAKKEAERKAFLETPAGKEQLRKEQAARDASRKAAAAKEAQNLKAARSVYAAVLREHFLDKGMDIKVAVQGKDSEQIHLTYALFNDVWVHNFRKGSLATEMKSMGFKRIYLKDGYNYSTYIYWDN